MLDEKDLEKIKELFTEGIEQLVLPHFEEIYKRLDRVEERLDKVEGRLDRIEERLDKVEEQTAFLTADMKIVKEYAVAHQEKLENYEERIKVFEEDVSKNNGH